MSIKSPPPDIVIGRLPIYLRALELLSRQGLEVTSSYELGERLGASSAQIRKDLAQFGDFGKQGTGYNINFLMEQLRQILQVNRVWEVVVMGAGHIGQALIHYQGFSQNQYRIVALFDTDTQKIGQNVNGITIHSADQAAAYVAEHQIKFAMLTTPADAAQTTADLIIEAGIQAILNYAPITLNVPEHVRVEYIDPISKLQHMTYYIEIDNETELASQDATDD